MMFLCRVLLYSTILVQFIASAENKNNTKFESSCNQIECLRCDLEDAQCVKCLYVILEDTRQCMRKCPPGFDTIWSRSTNVFGKMCAERSVLSLVSQREVGIIAGASLLGAVCVGVFLGFLVLHRKGTKSPPGSPPRALPRSLQDKRPKTEETSVKGKEREDFVAHLRLLRNDAPNIFRMMAETRNRFKGGSGPDNPSETRTKACKAVVRDLSRVLCLLSRKEEHLKTAPKDWDRLLAWTERLLLRYKRQQELKELEENGGESPSPTDNGRHLFITRQQKAQEERRRWIERTPSNDQKKKSPLEFCFKDNADVFDFSLRNNDEGNNSDKDSIPDSPPPKMALSPLNSTENLLPKPSPDGRRKIKRDLLHFNKQIWSKLTTFKDSSPTNTDIVSSDSEVDKTSGKCDLELGLSNDDFGSQNFFDHIEAFAFDLGQETALEEVNERAISDKNRINRKHGRHELKKIDSIWREPFQPKKFNLNHPKRTRLARSKNSLGKENRPSRIRRISSSLLRKDKKLIQPKDDFAKAGPRKRRPITRQKQVEKDMRSIIQEKLRKSPSFESDCSSVRDETIPCGPQTNLGRRTSSVNQVIVGDDIYLQVTKTPVMVHRVNTFSSDNVKNKHEIDSNEKASNCIILQSSPASTTLPSSNECQPTLAPVILNRIEKSSQQPQPMRRNSHHIINANRARRHSLAQDKLFTSKNIITRCEILMNV